VGTTDSDTLSGEVKGQLRRSITNPFKSGHHPVEEALMHAENMCRFEDLIGFQQDRAAVVAYLEPQYQRLVLAFNNIVAYIKSQKRCDCLFDTSTLDKSTAVFKDPGKHPPALSYGKALVLLKQFAEAFLRDGTPEMAIRVKEMQRSFDSIYSSTATALKELNHSLDAREFENFHSQFLALYKTLERRFLRVR
jgi:hypothetical protein